LKTFLINFISTSFTQIFILFGPTLLFGLVVHLARKYGIRFLSRVMGHKAAIILTGFLGVPIHEFGHAFFCLIFGHTITRIKLFDPDDETLGSVEHYYEIGNPWQIMGNYFIGTGPIIFGCIIIGLMITFLLPDGLNYFKDLMTAIKANGNGFTGLYRSFLDLFKLTFNTVFIGNFLKWQFWVFIFVSFNISMHMSLSPPDIKGALKGFYIIIISILSLDLLYVWAFFFIKIDWITSYMIFYNSILMIGAIFAVIFFMLILILYLIVLLIRKVKYRVRYSRYA
jgi:hypothetical protein